MKWTKPAKPKVVAGPSVFTDSLSGGPLDGRRIKNHSSDNSTLCFSLNGETGRYHNRIWRSNDV